MSAHNLIQFGKDLKAFPDLPFKMRNSLPSHPLFEPERIKKLLRTVPRRHIEIRMVQTRDTNDQKYARGQKLDDADPVEAFERLEEVPTWMLVHESWIHDRDYNDLVKAYVAELAGHCEEMQGGIYDIGCWLFLSSKSSVVHFHSDPDQSFLNQVKGSKTVYTYPARILPESAVENLVRSSDQGAVSYVPEYEKSLNPPVVLKPGDSVFLPLYGPHRVINDDVPCISWNVGFNTRKSLRRKKIHLVNLELRKFGLPVSSYDRSHTVDTLKHFAYFGFRVKNKLQRLMGIGATAK
ncbi:MAG TPA: hypothetical protein VK643_03730 [Burkholderiales bacterium]|nr:hypothetical protein [Burkholderiales bacterium]